MTTELETLVTTELETPATPEPTPQQEECICEPDECKEECEMDCEAECNKEHLQVEKVEKLEVQPAHYNDDVYRDRACDDDELRYQMIKKPVETETNSHLYDFCDTNLENKFRQVIQADKILPLETSKKSLTLKLKKNNDKTRDSIRETINKTFSTYYPEKILTEINSTVELLFLERMRDMNRNITVVHQGTYYTVHMTSEYKKKRFGTSFNLVTLEITTSKFQ
jgi:hypothetical protein